MCITAQLNSHSISTDKEALLLEVPYYHSIAKSPIDVNPSSSPCNWTGVLQQIWHKSIGTPDLSGLGLTGAYKSAYWKHVFPLRSLHLQNNQLTDHS
ncbi:hypothetical protein Leryth_005210 [Lithospermum erythrorhizon]|nr:hypothetical protein Leryth_005210 [Lithospermum erythrorhizon]